MPGNKIGGMKAAATNKERYGSDWYAKIGRLGGSALVENKGFGSQKVGSDGLTGAERARKAGAKGGAKSKRGPAKHLPHLSDEEITIRRAEERARLRAEIKELTSEEW